MQYGLDFGTSNTTLCYKNGDKKVLVPLEPDSDNPYLMPTRWFFDNEDRDWLIGSAATQRYRETFGDGRYLQGVKKVLADSSMQGTIVGGRFTPFEELVSIFFDGIKQTGDEYVGESVTNICIGRPVNFSEVGDNATALERISRAAKKVGFTNVAFEYEPLAGTRYNQERLEKPANLFTLDVGGGTTDISIVRTGVYDDEVLSSAGINIGGLDFSSAIMKNRLLGYFGANTTSVGTNPGQRLPFPIHLATAITEWYLTFKLVHDKQFLSSLKTAKLGNDDPKKLENLEKIVFEQLGLDLFDSVEAAKHDLSSGTTTELVFDEGGIDIHERISRKQFESYIEPHMKKIDVIANEVLGNAKMAPEDIDYVLFVGGSTKIPLFHTYVQRKLPSAEIITQDEFTSVALGLADHDFSQN